MNLFRHLVGARPLAAAREPGCGGCVHFHRDPMQLEAALAGLSALSSAHASVRADDGLCVVHQLLTNGRRRCAAFEARDTRSQDHVPTPVGAHGGLS